MNVMPGGASSMLNLDYPQSVVVVDDYETAQKIVDTLSDKEFPVENLCIVGTDLKTMERVIGRRTWGSVLGQGAVSGLGMGLLVGLMMLLFTPGEAFFAVLLTGLLVGVVIGMITAAITYAMSGGRRDFNSVQQVVATHYEVLAEHKVAAKAREMVSEMSFMRAKAFQS
ncbi:general stress protein [Cutibacterium sp.]|uniref:general stress protein n=1 Tax=Cutibacterium sp. TaxID=1912221 RepID=UPI0026DB175B|nr:general stress protein [Cutibacterium sp.]MDO4411550.1 hypothetical protein [Cutibacterium sp.]